MKIIEKRVRIRPEILKEVTKNKVLRRALEDYYEFESASAIFSLIKRTPERLTKEYPMNIIKAYLKLEENEIVEEIN